MKLTDDFDAHRARGAGDHAGGVVRVDGVEVLLLQLDDLEELLLGDLADLVAVRDLGAGLDLRGLLEEDGSGRGLQDEREGLVLVDGDDDREDHAGLVLGLGVEFLTERHDVDALRAERG
ncbi:MAG: hypothetical protein AN484_25860, partial [Aphanizomenon flos-aquae WA102]